MVQEYDINTMYIWCNYAQNQVTRMQKYNMEYIAKKMQLKYNYISAKYVNTKKAKCIDVK